MHFLDAKFQLLSICRCWFYPEETATFFLDQNPLGTFLGGRGEWGVRVITLVNNVRTEILITGSPHSCINFWSNCDPNLPLKMPEIKNSH